jgi:non-specific serine/threonine protein kinase
MALSGLARIRLVQKDMSAARALAEEALAARREWGDRWSSAMPLMTMGTIEALEGNYAAARARLEESLAIFREMGDRHFTAVVSSGLADTARLEGDDERAITIYQDILIAWRDLGNTGAVARCLECLAFIARGQGLALRAAQLLGSADAVRQANAAHMQFSEREECDRHAAALRAQLGEADWAAAWQAGQALTMDQAIVYAREAHRPRTAPP